MAILHNEDSQKALSTQETRYKNRLSGPAASRGITQKVLLKETPIAPIVKQLQNVMLDWDSAQFHLQRKHNAIVSKYREVAAKKSFGQNGMTEQAYWKWAWNLIAYEGVQRILEIIYSYRDELTTYPSFKQK